MNETNGSGIDYPKIELAGITYQLKVTRGVLAFRISKRGLSIADLNIQAKRPVAVAEFLHAMVQPSFPGEPEDVFEALLTEEKMGAATVAVFSALGKVFPSPSKAAAATVEKPLTQ